jgi:hypothetical protein
VWAIFSPEFSRPRTVRLAKTPMTFSEGPGRSGPAVEGVVGQSDALVGDQATRVGALVEVDDHQVG